MGKCKGKCKCKGKGMCLLVLVSDMQLCRYVGVRTYVFMGLVGACACVGVCGMWPRTHTHTHTLRQDVCV